MPENTTDRELEKAIEAQAKAGAAAIPPDKDGAATTETLETRTNKAAS